MIKIVAVLISFLTTLILMSCTKKIKTFECEKCRVFNEKNIQIDAKVYMRKCNVDVGEDQFITDEYTLILGNAVFDGKLSRGVLKNPRILVFYPEFRLVGVPNYEIKEYENYIEYEDVKKESFVVIKADTINNPASKMAITDIVYQNNQVKFNSFGKLKNYGDSIIITFKQGK